MGVMLVYDITNIQTFHSTFAGSLLQFAVKRGCIIACWTSLWLKSSVSCACFASALCHAETVFLDLLHSIASCLFTPGAMQISVAGCKMWRNTQILASCVS